MFYYISIGSSRSIESWTNNKSHENNFNNNQTADIYLLAYFWEPESCQGTSKYAGCDNPMPYWGFHFTIHGLWPQYSSGGYPTFCTNEAYNSEVTTKIGSDMLKYWPNIQYTFNDPLYTSFWEHEWSKHGTCTGLTQEDYFQTTLSLYQKFGTPLSVTTAVGSTISATKLRNSFGGSKYVSLQCDQDGSYLSGVYTCWSFVNKIPSNQIQCPEDVQAEDTCSASAIKVTSF